MKKVSIVLPTLNGARYLRKAIDSTLSQTWTEFELIVVDGGSKDGTLDILAGYDDPRLTVINQPANTGKLPGAINLGFDHSTGQYLTWMQDDDVYEPNAIETLAVYLDEHPQVDFVYSNYWWIDEKGERFRLEEVPPPDQLRFRNSIGHYFMYRRSILDSVGKYDPVYYMAEDYEYYLRIFLKHTMQPVAFPYYLYRAHPDSLTFKSYGKYWALRVAAQARRQWLKTGWRAYCREVAGAYIQEAFASYQNGDWTRCRNAVLRGLAYNPAWISNRGVTSLVLQSTLKISRKHKIVPSQEGD